jgi:hypothetical protein
MPDRTGKTTPANGQDRIRIDGQPYVEGMVTFRREDIKDIADYLYDADMTISIINNPHADVPGYTVAEMTIPKPTGSPPYYFRLYYPERYVLDYRRFTVYADIGCGDNHLLARPNGEDALNEEERAVYVENGVNPAELPDEHNLVLHLEPRPGSHPCPKRPEPMGWDGR